MFSRIFLMALIGVGVTLAFAFVSALLLAIPTMLLWNWLMPPLFMASEVTLLQAVGVNFLSALLFKSASVSASSN